MKKISKLMNLFLYFILFMLLIVSVTALGSRFFQDRSFGYYMKQIGFRNEAVSGSEVIQQLGEPVSIKYEYPGGNLKDRAVSILLGYDSFDFGISGDSLENPITNLVIKKPGIIKLKNMVDIGAPKAKADKAYRHEKSITGSYGFILGNKHLVQDGGGIWIYFELNENEIINRISITDGF